MLVEKPTRNIEDVDQGGNPPNLIDAMFPIFPPISACLRIRSPGTDSCGTSGGAQCCCGQLIPRRWQRRRRASPRRRQGASRVPAGSRSAGRAGAALREARPGKARPPGPPLPPPLPQPAPAATSSPALWPVRPLWGPQGWAGRSRWAPSQVMGQPARPTRRATGLCRADTPRSLPAPPPRSWQPGLCSRGRPGCLAGD
ncbi:translation initiation factor IF-2-like [Mustela erminea]|uniref:translation initiation factor IF-2-like n=1 Tax=Mustela erminea TaxID=36723 RepID=UPI001386DB57|nr:translation initiation factor IF-2-like [Mustela erminea]